LEKEEADPYFRAAMGCLADLLAWDGKRLASPH
jgi:hypothetical protein